MECPIIFGPVNKKLLIPFFLAISQIINNIFTLYYPGDSNQLLEMYASSIGFMLNLIIPHIKFFSLKTNESKEIISTTSEEKKKCFSKSCFWQYFILIFTYDLEIILLSVPIIIAEKSGTATLTSKLPFVSGVFSRESIMIVLIAIISYFILKYRNYIHNNISLVLFIITGIILDYMLDKFDEEFNGKGIGIIIMNLFELISSVTNLCYIKYMMDVFYYSYYKIAFALGLSTFILYTLAVPMFMLDEEQKKSFLDSFNNIGLLISRFIISIILQFFFALLILLTLAYFSPSHMLICICISKLIVSLIGNQSKIKYFSIIPFAFQFFCLMVYLEILELNFCGLNINTRRNIEERGEDEMISRSSLSRSSTLTDGIEYNKGYFIDVEDKNYKNVENNLEENKEIILKNSILEMQTLEKK